MTTRFPFHGAKVWETKIETGLVGVNGREADANHILSRHDQVYHHNPKVIEPSVPDEVEVLEKLMIISSYLNPLHCRCIPVAVITKTRLRLFWKNKDSKTYGLSTGSML